MSEIINNVNEEVFSMVSGLNSDILTFDSSYVNNINLSSREPMADFRLCRLVDDDKKVIEVVLEQAFSVSDEKGNLSIVWEKKEIIERNINDYNKEK